MRRGSTTTTHNLRLLVFFGILVAALVISSLILKFISLVRESRFDGEHFFVVSFSHAKDADIVGFDPKNKKMTILHVSGNSKSVNLQQGLGIPIDGEVDGKIASGNSIPSVLLGMFLRFQAIKTNLTILDIGRLAVFAKTIPQSDIQEKEMSLLRDEITNKDTVASLFVDPAIVEEKIDVEIVNASGGSGLGQRLERMLSHVGYTVIAVTTSPKKRANSSIIYYGEKTYTIYKLERIVNSPIEYTEKKQLATIAIILGEDMLKTSRF